MEPIKKLMSPSHALFPFLLVFQDTKKPESELPDHLQDWHELVYVYSGNGVFFIDDSFHTMESGSLFLIPTNTIHRALPDAANPVTSTAAFFGSNILSMESFGDRLPLPAILEEWRANKMYKLQLTPLQQERTMGTLNQLHQEVRQQQLGYRQAIALELQRWLLDIARASLDDTAHSRTPSDSVVPKWMTEALHYIEVHLSQSIYLSHLADIANVSQPYFSKIFKKMTGMNLTEYITTKRVVRAKEYLEKTDDTIACVSENCGFYSLPHFHRTFLKYTSMTPAAYRKHKTL